MNVCKARAAHIIQVALRTRLHLLSFCKYLQTFNFILIFILTLQTQYYKTIFIQPEITTFFVCNRKPL